MTKVLATVNSPEGQESHIKSCLTISPEEYMKDRVVFKINIYDKLAKRHRRLYQVTSLLGIILAASVPVLITLGVDPRIPTLLSLIVTIQVAMEKLFHFREHWRNYDEIAAFLRSEQLQFQTGVGEYKEKVQHNDKGVKSDKTFHLFVSRIEQAIGNERKDTIEMRTGEEN